MIALYFVSCSSSVHIKKIEDKLNFDVFKKSFIGLSIYDLDEKEYIYKFNEEKKFTPASNTKLLTFIASLEFLPKVLRSLRYKITNDSLIIWGTGDPSLLHYRLAKNDSVVKFLKSSEKDIFLSYSNDQTNKYGSGWAWDDYNDYYQVESSSLPIYGNVLTSVKDSLDTLLFYPNSFPILEDSLLKTKSLRVKRQIDESIFRFNLKNDTIHKTVETPFIYSDSLLIRLLNDSLNKDILLTDYHNLQDSEFLMSTNRDSLLKEMMTISDNFIAEQLLLMISDQELDSLSSRRARSFIKDSLFKNISNQKFRWVDASGLSRYNLISPKFLTDLLQYLYENYPFEYFNQFLARSAERGTLENRFQNSGISIYAKTGTLSNNHNLLGYFRSKSGKMICFSFMMNHYLSSTRRMIEVMDHLIMDLYHYY